MTGGLSLAGLLYLLIPDSRIGRERRAVVEG